MASAVQLHGLSPKIVKLKLNTIDTLRIMPRAAAVTRKLLKECLKHSGSDPGGKSSYDLNAGRKACVSVALLCAAISKGLRFDFRDYHRGPRMRGNSSVRVIRR